MNTEKEPFEEGSFLESHYAAIFSTNRIRIITVYTQVQGQPVMVVTYVIIYRLVLEIQSFKNVMNDDRILYW